MKLAGHAGGQIADAVQPLGCRIHGNGQLALTDSRPIVVIIRSAFCLRSCVGPQHQRCGVVLMAYRVCKADGEIAVALDGKHHRCLRIGHMDQLADQTLRRGQGVAVQQHLKVTGARHFHNGAVKLSTVIDSTCVGQFVDHLGQRDRVMLGAQCVSQFQLAG